MTCRFIMANGQTIQPDTYTYNPGSQAETTDHPVEDGSALADHIISKPAKVTLTTYWTPRPADPSYLPAGSDRPRQAFDLLTAILQHKRTLRIEVDGMTYTPAVLTNVSMSRTFEDGDSLTISVDATQIQIVSGQTVKVKVSQGLKKAGSKKKVVVTPTAANNATLAAVTVVKVAFTAAGAGGLAVVLP